MDALDLRLDKERAITRLRELEAEERKAAADATGSGRTRDARVLKARADAFALSREVVDGTAY